MFFISDALAQTADAAAQQPSALFEFLPLLLIFAIFYFLIIRPQSKKLQDHGKMVKALDKGDEVVTGGGIYGKITKAEDDALHVEIASGVVVKVTRTSVTHKIEKDMAKKETKKETKKTKEK